MTRRGRDPDRRTAEFDTVEPTRVDIPSYDRARAESPLVLERDQQTEQVTRLPPWSTTDLVVAFASGFVLAAMLVYLAMR